MDGWIIMYACMRSGAGALAIPQAKTPVSNAVSGPDPGRKSRLRPTALPGQAGKHPTARVSIDARCERRGKRSKHESSKNQRIGIGIDEE